MEIKIKNLAEYYAEKYKLPSSQEEIKQLLRKLCFFYSKEKFLSLMDVTLSSFALDRIITPDGIDFDKITPQMEEAFALAYPNITLESLKDYSPESLVGFINGWKGKLFEINVRDALNRGETVGDISLPDGGIAVLAECPTQAGWDLKILDSCGEILDEIQLKATYSLSYIRRALEKYPDIPIITTEFFGELPEGVVESEFCLNELNEIIQGPIENLLEKPEWWENVLNAGMPYMPFLFIMATEALGYLQKKKEKNEAVMDGLKRSGRVVLCNIPAAMLIMITGSVCPISFTSPFLMHWLFSIRDDTKKFVEIVNLKKNELIELNQRLNCSRV